MKLPLSPPPPTCAHAHTHARSNGWKSVRGWGWCDPYRGHKQCVKYGSTFFFFYFFPLYKPTDLYALVRLQFRAALWRQLLYVFFTSSQYQLLALKRGQFVWPWLQPAILVRFCWVVCYIALGVLEWRIRRVITFSSLHHGFISLQGCYVNLTDLNDGINQTKRLGGRVVVMVNSAQVFDTVPYTMVYKLPSGTRCPSLHDQHHLHDVCGCHHHVSRWYMHWNLCQMIWSHVSLIIQCSHKPSTPASAIIWRTDYNWR